MAVAIIVDNPEGSQEVFDTVREKIGLERPAGGISTSPGRARTAPGG